ncbi:hypothetical protein ACVWZ6_002270 [Bradyrhizobium sp. GM6.1]
MASDNTPQAHGDLSSKKWSSLASRIIHIPEARLATKKSGYWSRSWRIALLESFWQARHPPDTPPISVRHHPAYSEIEVIDDDLGRSAAGGLHTPASNEW